MSLRFIADWEERIVQQKELIAQRRRRWQPIKEAKAVLDRYEATLLQLRNHWVTMQELMGLDPEDKNTTLRLERFLKLSGSHRCTL